MTSKVAPCVTVMFCAAGCSTTAYHAGPQQGGLTISPPTRDKVAKAPSAAETIERAVATRKVRPSPVPERPVTVTVPLGVLMMDAAVPASPAADLRSDAVPLSIAAEERPSAVFAEPGPKAEFPAPATAKMRRYVTVGPEYFGTDSDIAPYVISRSSDTSRPAPNHRVTAVTSATPWQPTVSVTATPKTLARSSLPRSRPLPQSPTPSKLPKPLGDGERFAALPPRPAPSPSQAPSEPSPRRPMRLPVEPTAMGVLREGSLRKPLPHETTNLPESEAILGDGLLSTGRGLGSPPAIGDVAPVTQLYRLKFEEPPQPGRDAAALSLGTTAMPRGMAALSDAMNLPALPDDAPAPDFPRVRLDAILRAPVEIAVPKTVNPANDPAKRPLCAVHRGNGHEGGEVRMILVCEGTELSRADLLRAVIEGESALRDLRPFDAPALSTEKFGLDAGRFAAIADRPRNAADLVFLRDLRDVRREMRLKGRDFHLYRIKGHHGTATVLVETKVALDGALPLPAVVNQ